RRHHALDEARRQDVDPHLPRQAGDQEAGRDAHGQGQGLARVLGGRDQARAHPVRARGHLAPDGAGSPPSRRLQAAHQDPLRGPARAGRDVTVAKKGMQELVDLSAEELASTEQDLREELFQTRFKNQMRQLDNPLKIRHLRRQIARVRTLMTTPVKAQAPAAREEKAKASPAKKTKEKKAARAPAKEKAR